MTREEKIKVYKKAIDLCRKFEYKGKTMPYTSANGHIFSLINKNSELGIRFDKNTQERYMKQLGTGYFISYGAKMKGYVLMPEQIWEDAQNIAKYLMQGYEYVLTLEPK